MKAIKIPIIPAILGLFLLWNSCVTQPGITPGSPLDVTRQYIQKGALEQALAYLEEETDENSPEDQWLVLANLYLATDNTEKAQKAYTSILEKNPEQKESLLSLARIAFIQGNREQEETLLEDLVSQHPQYVPGLVAQGDRYLFQQNLPKAREFYTQANALEPTADGLGGLGRVEYEEKNLDQAIDLLSKALEIEEEDPGLYEARHLAHRDKELFRSALEDIDKAIEILPEDLWLRLTRAAFYWQDLKRPNSALPDLKAAAEIDPEHPLTLGTLAEVSFLVGDVETAYSSFKKLIAMEKHADTAIPRQALLALTMGDFDTASEYALRFTARFPREIGFHLIAGLAELGKGNPGRGREIFQQGAAQFQQGSLEWETFRFLIDPRNDFAFRNIFAKNTNQALKARIQFYIGYYNYLQKLLPLARDSFDQTLKLIERGIPERAMAIYLLSRME